MIEGKVTMTQGEIIENNPLGVIQGSSAKMIRVESSREFLCWFVTSQ